MATMTRGACGRISAIEAATRRGAALTSQLLTFARRQSVNPQAVDVAERIDALREVLQTGVGSAVTLQFDFDQPSGRPWSMSPNSKRRWSISSSMRATPWPAAAPSRFQRITRRSGKKPMPATCRDLGGRYRRRHRPGCARQDLRSLLHHQADRQGHGSGALAGSRLRASGRRNGQGRRASSARAPGSRCCCRARKTSRGSRKPMRSKPAAAAPYCWSKTIRMSQPSAPPAGTARLYRPQGRERRSGAARNRARRN